MTHIFSESLARERKEQRKPYVQRAYNEAFPQKQFLATETRKQLQRLGVDRWIVVPDSDTAILVEEKFRFRIYENDVLLEIYSDFHQKKAGWFEKDLICQVLAYFWAPSQRAIFFDWRDLKTLYKEIGSVWSELAVHNLFGYEWIDAPNPTYTTRSLIVPTSSLKQTIIYDSSGAVVR